MKQYLKSTTFILLVFASQLEALKSALVCGAGGFVGSHLVKQLKKEGFFVRGVDRHYPRFSSSAADEFLLLDLRKKSHAQVAVKFKENQPFDEVYQLAAEVGGMGFIPFNDALIAHNSLLINLNVLDATKEYCVGKIFFSSSSCVYPINPQSNLDSARYAEHMAYPANPDSVYGWEKLISEKLYQSYAKDYGIRIRIGRFHNIFGPEDSWNDGREKVVAALCRKIALSQGDPIEIWGDGSQQRSFMFIDECIKGIRKVMQCDQEIPVLNIGSDRLISIKEIALKIAAVAGKQISIKPIDGPVGIAGRGSDNTLMQQWFDWSPSTHLKTGLKQTYKWVCCMIDQTGKDRNYSENNYISSKTTLPLETQQSQALSKLLFHQMIQFIQHPKVNEIIKEELL